MPGHKLFNPSTLTLGGAFRLLLTQSVDDRVMLFLDLGNISRSLDTRTLDGFRLDWFRLAKHLAGPRRLVAAYAFDTAPDRTGPSPKQRFHDHLRYSGFRVVTRPFRPDDRTVHSELEVALATEVVSAAHRDLFDVAIVVSGERVLVPALERVSREGKLVEIAATHAHFSPELRKAADRVHNLDELPILEIFPDAIDDHDDYETEAEVPA